MVHEAFCLDSQGAYLWGKDDFIGDSLDARWSVAGGAGGTAAVVDAQDGGICRITTHSDDDDYYQLDWNSIRSLLVSKKVTIEFRVKLERTTNIYIANRIDDGSYTKYAGFRYDTDAAHTNWQIESRDTGTSSADSGIAVDTAFHIFKIECFPTGQVHFYIDNVETANSPLTTAANIPNEYLQPLLLVRTRTTSTVYMDIDYIQWRQDL